MSDSEMEFVSSDMGIDDDEEKDDLDDDDFVMSRHSIATMDYRLRWIRDRALKFMGIFGHELQYYKLLNANNRYYEDKILNFLILDLYGVTDLERKVIFFYATYSTELVQEEVPVWESAQASKLAALTALAMKGKSRRFINGAGIERKGQKKTKPVKLTRKKSKKSKSKVPKVDASTVLSQIQPSTSTMKYEVSSMMAMKSEAASSMSAFSEYETGDEEEEEEEETEEETLEKGSGDTLSSKKDTTETFITTPPPADAKDKYVMIKKMVEKVKKTPILHIICGEVDGSRTDLQDTTLFYFLRVTDEGIPSFDSYQECCDQITKYLVVGSLQGKFLVTLNKMLSQVFRPLVESQFHGPRFSTEDTDSDDESSNLAHLMNSRSSVFRRPSEFRRVSLMQKKYKEIEEDDAHEEEILPARSSTLTYKESKRETKMKPKLSKSSGKSISVVSMDKSKQSIDKSNDKQEAVPKEWDQSKLDILNYLDSLITNVEWTLEHIEGDILLTMPNIPELEDPTCTDEMLENNTDVIKQLEDVIMSWGVHIEKVLETFQTKVVQGRGPLAEFSYWQDRETGLLMLVEQLKIPMARRILGLLNKVQSPIASNFEFFYADLWKYYAEARDNDRFLQTVVRHFKVISDSDDFKLATQSISALVDGLRMIWILSSYYSVEEKMMGLMERISWQLCQTVINHLGIKDLFKRSLDTILEKTKDACTMLKSWKKAYLQVRTAIEGSGKGNRWEFDQNRLFSSTEYIATVCEGLNQAASVLQDFYNIFGPYLKSIISDPAQIDTIIKRVARLILPIQDADFNIYDQFNKENWEATMSLFYEEVRFLENEAKFFIDECFMVLVSAEQALKVLLMFKNLKTRASIQEQLSRKFGVIVQQFSKEVSIVEGIYNRGKRFPPLLTHHPPMAGAIFWIRQLFHRLRRPVLILQEVPELKHSDMKLAAFSQYLEVATEMKTFEDTKFTAWVNKAQAIVSTTMKKNILKMVQSEPDKGVLTFPDSEKIGKHTQTTQVTKKGKNKEAGSVGSGNVGSVQKSEGIMSKPSNISKGENREMKQEQKSLLPSVREKTSTVSSSFDKVAQPKPTWTDFLSDSLLIECKLRFEVNFDPDVFEIIQEAELIEQLGFSLSPAVKEVGIQKDRLRQDIDILQRVVNKYNSMLDEMSKPDIQLLKTILLDIEKHIQPGVMRINWDSLNIVDFGNSCEKLLKNLSSTIDQINHMKADLDNRIFSEMQRYNLFSLSVSSAEDEGSFLPCKTYFLEIHNRRTELVSSMRKLYESTGPLLKKLESLVLGTATGLSPAMQLFYETYEKKIFGAFITCMVNNLDSFNKTLTASKPIFQVDAVLIASEAVLRPSPGEIYTIIIQNVKNMLEELKHFPRWMNGTCLECSPQKKDGVEDYVMFSFFEDILNIQAVNDSLLMVQSSVHKLVSDCWQYLHKWKKYSNLWTFDKNLAAEKFTATKPTLFQYDEKFTFYENILEELSDIDPHYDLYCIRINLHLLLSGIEAHAKEWKQVLGNYLLSETIEGMKDLRSIIDAFRAEVELVITGLDRFTSVMQAISDIKKTAVQAEVRFKTYQETFKAFRSHGISFPEEEEQVAYELQSDWESLYLGALYRASTLESTSDRFADMTKEQIDNFVVELQDFADDFQQNGPGSVGENLELGLRKMEEYGRKISKLEERRQIMINSELLFDLPATDYSVFLDAKRDYEGMEQLYKLYKEQKKAREQWAQTLWVNLNPQLLIDGMDHYIREFRKFPEFIRKFAVGQTLDANMKSFKNSVPLFIELKNEAMRERHWKDLMRKTGQYFDMDPDSGKQLVVNKWRYNFCENEFDWRRDKISALENVLTDN